MICSNRTINITDISRSLSSSTEKSKLPLLARASGRVVSKYNEGEPQEKRHEFHHLKKTSEGIRSPFLVTVLHCAYLSE